MKNNPFSLEGKTILVTGASSGIGRATAIESSKMGAKVIITGRDETRLSETYSSLNTKHGDHLKINADLRNTGDISELVDKLPALNGIVHCAGIVKPLPIKFATKEQIDYIFGINFNASVIVSQQLIKNKKILKNASIVFMSSISSSFVSYGGGALYTATKAALNGLAKGMAIDLAAQGIRVNCICPGMIETNIMNEGIITNDQLNEDAKKYPLGRYGKPEEVAYAAIYLLSDASQWITGSNLLIDGGFTLL
ncbi:MAG: SDR family NAD(P)-dependent oxidoreductase [Bacteroidetes bacterium]|nr:SDR family NAD(P)-dependent oxidoreductase [Bacteroidota bacterium]